MKLRESIEMYKPLDAEEEKIKRDILDYIRFFIINKEKMFIYPPAPYLITHQYFFDKMNPDADCNEAYNPFPLCYYNYLNKN